MIARTAAGRTDPSPNRGLILCIDDFGLAEGIDDAVLALVDDGRATATSVMVGGPTVALDAPRLAAVADRVDIGLHLTFTDLAPLGPMQTFAPAGEPPRLSTLVLKGLGMLLPYVEIKAEIGRQIDRFEDLFGRMPDHVDGHQHVHLLPQIRSALMEFFDAGRLKPGRGGDDGGTYIRSTLEPFAAIRRRGIEVPKAAFLSVLARGMAVECRRRGIPVNDSFRGVTAFRTDRPFKDVFRPFLAGEGARPLAMCHPAIGGPFHATDPIGAARMLEWAYFSGDDYPADLARAGLTPMRMRDFA